MQIFLIVVNGYSFYTDGCGMYTLLYIFAYRNRRNRELTILKAMENGAKTLFDVVAYTYRDVNPSLWIHASSNVRLHVDHLAQQDKLPKVAL